MSEEQQAAETPAPKPVLGVDPVEATPEPTPEPVEPEPQTTSDNVTLSRAQLETLQRDAARMQAITEDPTLSRLMTDHLNGRREQKLPQQEQAPSDGTSIEALAQQLSEGKQQLQQLMDGYQKLALDNFKMKNPDYDQLQSGMQEVIQQYPGTSPEVALELTRLRNTASEAQSQTGPDGGVKPAPTTENGRATQVPDVQQEIADIQRALMDRSQHKTFEDVLDAAVDHAQKLK